MENGSSISKETRWSLGCTTSHHPSPLGSVPSKFEVVNGQPCPVFDIQTYLSRLSIAHGSDDKVAFCSVSGY